MRFISWIGPTCIAIAVVAQSSAALPESPTPATGKAAVDQLIPWLLDENQQLRGVPFSEVIFDTTGQRVLPFDAKNAVDQRVAKAISAACHETMKRLNAPNSAIQHVDRINEVSSHFDDSLRELLNATPGLRCVSRSQPRASSSVPGIPICASPMWRANASFIWTRSFMLPEAATAVSARFISSQRKRPTKCARTRRIW
jgi:hypothetical protein